MAAPRVVVLAVALAPGCFSPQGVEGSATGTVTTSSTGESTSASALTTGGAGTATGTDGAPTTDGTTGETTSSTGVRTSTGGPGCGDGIIEAPEECDDGNGIDDDGCTNACTIPSCGDGIVEGGEECDDGNAIDTDDCTNECTHARCGDKIIHAGVEECDGGVECVTCRRTYLRVFVTAEAYPSGLGGIAGADAKCQQEADEAGLQGVFIAWLSTDNEPIKERLMDTSRAWMLVEGDAVSVTWSGLFDGSVDAPINRLATGAPITEPGAPCGSCLVWTGTLVDGLASGQDCAEWVAMVGEMPTVGDCGSSEMFWTERCMGQSTGCAQAAHLYCFEKGLP